MGMSEGNWRSQVKWNTQNGKPPDNKDYVEDGLLHVCPYADGGITAIDGDYITVKGSHRLVRSTCELAGEGRFKIKAQWTTPGGGKTFHYYGNGRVIQETNGPTFIYGTVTSDGGADVGAWEAVRVGPTHGPGPGEEPRGSDQNSTPPPH